MEEVIIIGFQHNAESMQHTLTVNFTHQDAMQATRIHSCQMLYSGQRGAISLRVDTLTDPVGKRHLPFYQRG